MAYTNSGWHVDSDANAINSNIPVCEMTPWQFAGGIIFSLSPDPDCRTHPPMKPAVSLESVLSGLDIERRGAGGLTEERKVRKLAA